MRTACLVVLCLVGVAVGDYCSRPNLDCAGHDIRSFTADTDACKAACDAESECKSIQSLNGNCWLKRYACPNGELRAFNHANDYVKVDGRCRSSSPYYRKNNKYCHRVDTDCAGHDIAHVGVVADVDACQDICDFLPDCKSIQFLDNRNCWVKRHACSNSELRPYPGANDYVKAVDGDCGPYNNPRQKYCQRDNMDCAGHDIYHLNWVQTRKECQELCDWNEDCKSIQYKTPNCWLKRHVCSNDELRPFPGYSDYVKIGAKGSCADYKVIYNYRYCARPEKDCAGHDILSLKTDSAKNCQEFCSYKTECKSIQYYKGTCWLKRHLCTDGQLRDLAQATDYVKIARSASCNRELAKLA